MLAALQILKTKIHKAYVLRTENMEESVRLLRSIDQDSAQHMRDIDAKQTSTKFVELAHIFYLVADLHMKLGNITEEIQFYNSAAMRYQYVLKLVKKAHSALIIPPQKPELDGILRTQVSQFAISDESFIINIQLNNLKKVSFHNLKEIHNIIVTKSCISNANIGEDTTSIDNNFTHKSLLTELRDFAKTTIKSCDTYLRKQYHTEYVSATRSLFESIATKMISYLKMLYTDAEMVLGPAPCQYAVIGFGSMALQQITPYSDLEFAILTENEMYKTNPDLKVQEYFKNLTHYVHFKVICLGETVIPASAYPDVNMDSMLGHAVAFDLGGKTPLGRMQQDKDYELIQTVEKMLAYMKNTYTTDKPKDKKLSHILSKTCYVHGSYGLVYEYQKEVKEFLLSNISDRQKHCEIRALEMLSGSLLKLDYIPQNIQSNKIDSIVGNLEEFAFKPYDTEGQTLQVKQEIYRIPDRMIYNLGLIYGIQGDSSWDTVEKLVAQKLIQAEAGTRLNKALSFATNLRLKTYNYYGYQQNKIDIKSQSDINSSRASDKIFRLSDHELSHEGSVFEFYYIVLPLIARLKDFCEKSQDLTVEQKSIFFVDDAISYNNLYHATASIKGMINLRMMRYEEALKYFLEDYKELSNKYQQQNCKDIALSLNNVGCMYRLLGKQEKALEYMRQALKIQQEILVDKLCPDIAKNLFDIGLVHAELGNYKDALEYEQKALEMRKALACSIVDILSSLNAVCSIYLNLGHTKQAIVYVQESLALSKALKKPHIQIAKALEHIGSTYGLLGDYKQALEYMQKSLAMKKELFTALHPSIALGLNNVGCIYVLLGDYTKAIEYTEKALYMRETMFLGSPHSTMALSLKNMIHTRLLGKHEEALDYTHAHLVIFRTCFDTNSLEMTQSGFKFSIIKKQHAYDSTEQKNFEANKILQESAESSLVQYYDSMYKWYDPAKKILSSTKIKNIVQKDEKILYELSLKRVISNFEPIPHRLQENIRVAVDYFNAQDLIEDPYHHWHYRVNFVKELFVTLGTDVMYLQELSPNQGIELVSYFRENFEVISLSRIPSDIETGAIIRNHEVERWYGKFIRISLIAIFVHKDWNIIECNRFWLNSYSLDIPDKADRGDTDKDFDNMHTYRTVLWATMQNSSGKFFFIFNLRYPSISDGKIQCKCAALEVPQIQDIVENSDWTSSGDRNIISGSRGNENYNPEMVYRGLVGIGCDIRDAKEHYGISTIWLGFSYDKYKGELNRKDMKGQSVLDITISNKVAKFSFCYPGMCDLESKELIDLSDHNVLYLAHEARYFASDHALIGADFDCELC